MKGTRPFIFVMRGARLANVKGRVPFISQSRSSAPMTGFVSGRTPCQRR
jgi:hypothetical protein